MGWLKLLFAGSPAALPFGADVPMSPPAIAALGDAGWTPDRTVDVATFAAAVGSAFPFHAAARAFLSRFGGLEVSVPIDGAPDLRGFVHFDPAVAVRFLGGTDDLDDLRRLIPKPVCPVGTTSGHSVFVLMDDAGATYLLDRDWHVFAPLARTADAAVELLCGGRNGRVDSILLNNAKPTSTVLRENAEREHWDLKAFPDVKAFFPASSLEPARRPPTVHPMPKAMQSIITKDKVRPENFDKLMCTNGGFVRGVDSKMYYYAAHTENVLAIRAAASFQVSGLPPGVPRRPIRAGESILIDPAAMAALSR